MIRALKWGVLALRRKFAQQYAGLTISFWLKGLGLRYLSSLRLNVARESLPWIRPIQW